MENVPQEDFYCIILQQAFEKLPGKTFSHLILAIRVFSYSLPHELFTGCSPAENNQDLRSL